MWHPPPPRVWVDATERLACVGSTPCRTNAGAQCPALCCPPRSSRLRRSCQSYRSRAPWPQLVFSGKKTKNRYCAQSSKEHENVKYKKEPCKAYLHLVLWDLKAEGLVVVRVQCVLLHSRLLLLQPLAVLHKMNLHVGICRGLPVQEVMHLHTVDVSACVLCILIVFWEHLICD